MEELSYSEADRGCEVIIEVEQDEEVCVHKRSGSFGRTALQQQNLQHQVQHLQFHSQESLGAI